MSCGVLRPDHQTRGSLEGDPQLELQPPTDVLPAPSAVPNGRVTAVTVELFELRPWGLGMRDVSHAMTWCSPGALRPMRFAIYSPARPS